MKQPGFTTRLCPQRVATALNHVAREPIVSEQLQAIATVMSLVNPAICAAMFTQIILFAASPGTMTGVITLAVAHSRTDIPRTALVAIGVTAVVTFCAMMVLSSLGGKKQGGFVHETATRFMGLIVIAMGIQFALTGYKAFMA
jgi:multiple antibiotic resistance protein